VDGRRVLWVGIVVFFLALAVAGPAAMVHANRPAGGQAEAAAADGGGGAAGGSVVKMQNIAFVPATLTVERGTEVVFQNLDTAPHTVTAKIPGGVDSGTLNTGKSFRLVVDQPLDYVCTIHPNMTGKILLSG
jgi:plastocyanin